LLHGLLKMKQFVRENLAFLAVGALLVVYVALCTRWRDGILGADAWEHHRTIVALVEDLWHPENPTYATDDTSIRFSPYTVTQALICRATGWTPYDVLSGAAVFNTILLVAGVWYLLHEFGEEASAAAVLVVMVGLYGEPPAYANSYALADLPWHQVNPSAFAFGITLFAWVIFLRAGRTGPGMLAVSVLVGVALLDHGMTGLFALLGLLLFGLSMPSERGFRVALSLVLVSAGAAVVCVAWPWYSFLQAVRLRPDNDYWFNPYILRSMLTVWAWPAYLCGLAALSVRRPFIRSCLKGAVVSFTIAVAAFVLRSPTVARLPMPAMIFLHVPIGVFCHEHSLFTLSIWPKRLGALLKADDSALYPAIISTMVALIYLGSLAPQLVQVATGSHLARPYLAPLVGKPTKLVRYRALLDELLSRIGRHDVVLSDRRTSWMIPSSRGRIVAALHYEFFVKGQAERAADLEDFFNEATSDKRRLQILRTYHVRWIVLNPAMLPPRLVEVLMEPAAVVATVDSLTLLDAEVWARRVPSRAPRDKATVNPARLQPAIVP
jgi:hypothetical protein